MAKNSKKTVATARRVVDNKEWNALVRAFDVQSNRVARVGKKAARDPKLFARMVARMTTMLDAIDEATTTKNA